MRIAIGCDDTGLALKEALVAALEADGHDVLDLGTFSTDPVDYPDYARAVGQAVLRGFVDASLLLCASGTGGGIPATKTPGHPARACRYARTAPPGRARAEADAPLPAPPAVGPAPRKLPAGEETLRFPEQHEFRDRLWVKDATLWKGEAATVRNRLGWLPSPTIMRSHAEDIRTFADEIRRLQYSQVIVLGMGGSSLTGEVLNETFGSKMGFPDMLVLDSTDPGAVKQILDTFHLSRALFVVSSKSGTTAETLAAYSFFRGQVEAAASPRPGMQFVAITDPGRPLDKLATETGFRRTLLHPAPIRGPRSRPALSSVAPRPRRRGGGSDPPPARPPLPA